MDGVCLSSTKERFVGKKSLYHIRGEESSGWMDVCISLFTKFDTKSLVYAEEMNE